MLEDGNSAEMYKIASWKVVALGWMEIIRGGGDETEETL